MSLWTELRIEQYKYKEHAHSSLHDKGLLPLPSGTMINTILPTLAFITAVLAARPFLNEPDTGLEDFVGPDFPKGQLLNLSGVWSLPDFEWSARNFLNNTAYAWIRYGTAGEYSYRNNLEGFAKVGLRPRMLTGQKPVDLS